MKLTNRDKMLLTVVLLIIVWAIGIVFFIKPKIDTVSKNQKELESVEAQLVQAKQDVEAAKTIKEDCNDALKVAQEGAANFFNKPAAYEAEQYLAKVMEGDANGNGKIEISSLSITGPSAASLTSYVPTGKVDVSTPIDNSAILVNGQEQNANISYGETLGCFNYSVSFKAKRPDLMKFLTNIKATENGNSLFVTSLSIADNNLPDNEYLEGSMNFTLYFVQKLEGSDVDDVIENQKQALGLDQPEEN